MFTIILFITILSFLVFVHELGHFLAAKLSGVLVKEFSIGFPPHIFKKKVGETEYKVGILPIGGYVNLYGENKEQLPGEDQLAHRSFSAQAGWKRLFILSAGVIMNVLTAMALIMLVLVFAGKQRVEAGIALTEIFPDGPAAEAGLEQDSVIVRYGVAAEPLQSVFDTEGFIGFVQEQTGNEINLEIADTLGADETMLVSLIPTDYYGEGRGSLGVRIGLTSEYVYTKIPWYQIPTETIKETMYIFGLMIEGLAMLVRNITQGIVPTDVAGPVGIAVVSADVARQGIVPLTQFVALISLNLALVNILPFPALDGGRLAFVLLEILLRRSLDNKIQYWIHLGGFVLLIGLFIVITVYDVVRFF